MGKCDRCGEEVELDLIEFHQDHCTPDAAWKCAEVIAKEIRDGGYDTIERMVSRHVRAYGVGHGIERFNMGSAAGASKAAETAVVEVHKWVTTLTSAARAYVDAKRGHDAAVIGCKGMEKITKAVMAKAQAVDALAAALPKGGDGE